LRELIATDAERLLGNVPAPQGRFPLLLKFIDAQQELSVQVHPNDEQAAKLGPGMFGKTEAWVILDACPNTSKIYAGFAPDVTAEHFRGALHQRRTPSTLHSFTPKPGDCVFLEAGTVHAIGANILLFEVQQTSDITYRLYDWDRVDAKTGQPRQLHVDDGLACADFERGPCPPVDPTLILEKGKRREGLVQCRHFQLTRHTSRVPFRVGAIGQCRVVVCVGGSGQIESVGVNYPLQTGDTVLLPASVGSVTCRPAGEIVLLECGLPDTQA
jgi:mannose-6-phosphate isomerase